MPYAPPDRIPVDVNNAAASSSRMVIDPALVSLPDDEEEDFPSVKSLLRQKARPAAKVAGSRRSSVADPKGKGKARATELTQVPKGTKRKAPPASKEGDTKKPRGRAPGVANYSTEDLDALLDLLEEALPTGAKAWVRVVDDYTAWAEENGRPVRTLKSLETKYKQVNGVFHHYLITANSISFSSLYALRSPLVLVNVRHTSSELIRLSGLPTRRLVLVILMTARLSIS